MRVTEAVWPFRLSLHCLFLLLVAGLFVLPSQAERKTATLNQTNSAAGPAKPLPTRVRRSARTRAAARNPQISKIVAEINPRNIEDTIHKLVSFGTRNTLSDQNNPNRGIGAARDWLYAEFQKAAIFMTVPGEEQGLLGATYFAETSKKNNVNIEAMFTNDIIGSSLGGNGLRDPHTMRVFSEGVPSNETPAEAISRRSVGGENDSTSRQLARFIKETSEAYLPSMKVWMIYRRDRYGRGGDHQPFLERGYAAVRFTEPNEDYHHQHQSVRIENGIQYGDLPQFDDFKYIADVARVNAAALAALALSPARPANVFIATRLSNDSELKWDANKEPDVAGYEIVWRDTTAATWTNARAVGNVLTFTMKSMSKDNYFFGVRAVDKQGNRSQVTYPKPQPRPPRANQPAAPPLD